MPVVLAIFNEPIMSWFSPLGLAATPYAHEVGWKQSKYNQAPVMMLRPSYRQRRMTLKKPRVAVERSEWKINTLTTRTDMVLEWCVSGSSLQWTHNTELRENSISPFTKMSIFTDVLSQHSWSHDWAFSPPAEAHTHVFRPKHNFKSNLLPLQSSFCFKLLE